MNLEGNLNSLFIFIYVHDEFEFLVYVYERKYARLIPNKINGSHRRMLDSIKILQFSSETVFLLRRLSEKDALIRTLLYFSCHFFFA